MEYDLKNIVQKLEVIEALIHDQNLNSKEILDFREACNFLSLSRSTLYKLTSKGCISYYKPNGKLIYFNKKELINWITRQRVESNREIQQKAINRY